MTPTLISETGGNITLCNVDVEVTTAGPLTSTTLELSFRNKGSEELDGSLFIPLPRGAVISEFALVDPHTRKKQMATIVSKTTARIAYEKGVRTRTATTMVEEIDSGYRMRVYPIPANGIVTIAITYVLLRERATLVAPPQWSPIFAALGGMASHLVAAIFNWLPIRDL